MTLCNVIWLAWGAKLDGTFFEICRVLTREGLVADMRVFWFELSGLVISIYSIIIYIYYI
jgi:hypothetical protein